MIMLSGLVVGLLAMTGGEPPAATNHMATWQLDSSRSNAAFSVRVLWMIPIDGAFGSIRGDVHIDRVLSQVRVDATIDTNAVNMRRSGIEDWVKSEEFFDVGKFPEIRFQSESFPLARLSGGGDLRGSLTLRGIRRQVLFALQPASCERPAIDCPLEANGTVRRSEFGMRTRRATLSDKVELSFSIRMSESALPSIDQ